MKTPRISALLAMLVLSAISANSLAAGLYFLSRTPMARFSPADNDIFRAAAIDALDNAADNERRTWGNPETGARGVITPLASVDDPVSGFCREVRVSNEAGGTRRSGVYRACRATNGTWRLLGAGGDGPAADLSE